MGASTPSLSGHRFRETLLEMGQRALGRGDWQQAAEVFGQLLGAEPGVVQGWLGLGIAALEQKRYRMALQALEQALEQARSLAPEDLLCGGESGRSVPGAGPQC
ncbi:MAG: tetratricopeptide repeat protein [Cyanobium sp. 49614_E6]|jgi:tetratricopeptide (TPR) repeat protein|nr:tetratricopeptide repeat protein [Cyanobium sp. 49614_E6]